jgi:hypothetical protein
MRYYEYIVTDFKSWWIIMIIVIAIGFVCSTVRMADKGDLLTGFVACGCVAVMGIICFGVYPCLSKPLYNPRAMYGFGVYVTILASYVIVHKSHIIFEAVCILLGWVFFVFAFTYGNALSVQKEYTDFRIEQVVNELNCMDIFADNEEVYVRLDGNAGLSPIIESMPQDYQILNRLIPRMFADSWAGKIKFLNYYGLENIVYDDEIDLETYNMECIVDKVFYTIYSDGLHVLIKLK